MVYESREGTKWAESQDGIAWAGRGVLAPVEGKAEAFGHVTPFLWVPDGGDATLYFGAAGSPSWDANAIAKRVLPEFPPGR